MDSKLPNTFVDFYQVRKHLCTLSRGVMLSPLIIPVLFQLFLQNVGVVAVAASVIPIMLVPILLLLLFFLYLRRFYLCISRDVKRLEATSNFHLFLSHAISIFGRKALVNCFCLCLFPACLAARSNIFSHLSSSLQGLATIRAFRAQERQQHAFDAHQDLHSGSVFTLYNTEN